MLESEGSSYLPVNSTSCWTVKVEVSIMDGPPIKANEAKLPTATLIGVLQSAMAGAGSQGRASVVVDASSDAGVNTFNSTIAFERLPLKSDVIS